MHIFPKTKGPAGGPNTDGRLGTYQNEMNQFQRYVKLIFPNKWTSIVFYIGVWGFESNREIDFGFGSCARARALDVESERAQNFR